VCFLYDNKVIVMNFKNNNDLIKIALRIREIRKKRNLTLDDLAIRSGLSKGLLSKIENFRSIPSLPTLAVISESLGVDMADLVRGVGNKSEKNYCLVKAAERTSVAYRDDAVGFLYETIISQQLESCFFESLVLTVKPGGKRKAITSDADQFIFILKGEINFHLGGELIPMEKGDALLFDGCVPHVSQNKSTADAQLLAVYLLESAR
jgi:transcriptional regulator with XRE-family HTH domain